MVVLVAALVLVAVLLAVLLAALVAFVVCFGCCFVLGVPAEHSVAVCCFGCWSGCVVPRLKLWVAVSAGSAVCWGMLVCLV